MDLEQLLAARDTVRPGDRVLVKGAFCAATSVLIAHSFQVAERWAERHAGQHFAPQPLPLCCRSTLPPVPAAVGEVSFGQRLAPPLLGCQCTLPANSCKATCEPAVIASSRLRQSQPSVWQPPILLQVLEARSRCARHQGSSLPGWQDHMQAQARCL